MLGYAFFILDKLDLIACFATGKAVVSIGFRVYFATGFVVGVEGGILFGCSCRAGFGNVPVLEGLTGEILCQIFPLKNILNFYSVHF